MTWKMPTYEAEVAAENERRRLRNQARRERAEASWAARGLSPGGRSVGSAVATPEDEPPVYQEELIPPSAQVVCPCCRRMVPQDCLYDAAGVPESAREECMKGQRWICAVCRNRMLRAGGLDRKGWYAALGAPVEVQDAAVGLDSAMWDRRFLGRVTHPAPPFR